jgi:hypothetical protein
MHMFTYKYVVLAAAFAILSTSAAATETSSLVCAPPGSEVDFNFIPSQEVYTLDVTFPGQPPAAAVDKVLRDCLAAAVRKDSTSDIVVTPW